ncbi:MAG: hypothetical protein HQL20_09355 [Candidatus Omnitrophica bacterium]|nr:hypothetical protein [Candidatus Omnitrophota bacterium]
MKHIVKSVLMASMLVCLIMGSALAQAVFYDPTVEIKAFLFDNNTRGEITTNTQNIGIRITAINNSASPLVLKNVTLGMLTLTPVNLPSLQTISWPLAVMNSNGPGNVAIASAIGPVTNLVLPIAQAQVQSSIIMMVPTYSKIENLKSGYYVANLSVNAFSARDGKMHTYTTIKEPLMVK